MIPLWCPEGKGKCFHYSLSKSTGMKKMGWHIEPSNLNITIKLATWNPRRPLSRGRGGWKLGWALPVPWDKRWWWWYSIGNFGSRSSSFGIILPLSGVPGRWAGMWKGSGSTEEHYLGRSRGWSEMVTFMWWIQSQTFCLLLANFLLPFVPNATINYPNPNPRIESCTTARVSVKRQRPKSCRIGWLPEQGFGAACLMYRNKTNSVTVVTVWQSVDIDMAHWGGPLNEFQLRADWRGFKVKFQPSSNTGTSCPGSCDAWFELESCQSTVTATATQSNTNQSI